jgi:hypothetical protein
MPRSCAASARPSTSSARTPEPFLSAWDARRRPSAPRPPSRACLDSALDGARAALDALAGLDDDALVEVEIKQPRATRAALPVGYLRQYLAAQFVPGREVLLGASCRGSARRRPVPREVLQRHATRRGNRAPLAQCRLPARSLRRRRERGARSAPASRRSRRAPGSRQVPLPAPPPRRWHNSARASRSPTRTTTCSTTDSATASTRQRSGGLQARRRRDWSATGQAPRPAACRWSGTRAPPQRDRRRGDRGGSKRRLAPPARRRCSAYPSSLSVLLLVSEVGSRLNDLAQVA